jgi:hypothetical protein
MSNLVVFKSTTPSLVQAILLVGFYGLVSINTPNAILVTGVVIG